MKFVASINVIYLTELPDIAVDIYTDYNIDTGVNQQKKNLTKN